MSFIRNILLNLPEVKGPLEKRLSFSIKLKWTLIILISFFILANIPLYGLASSALEQFKYLAIILGTKFGSIISLGIGPIVMASIILQLLVGSKLLNIDMNTAEGKRYFQGLQKTLAIFFCIFEAIVYVLMGGLTAMPGLAGFLILQLVIGGLLIIYMDEVVSKWGFGQGVSLFIVAGVAWSLFTNAFGFLGPQGQIQPIGKVLVFLSSISGGNIEGATLAAAAIFFTMVVFAVVVWAQSIKVEVPLSFGRIRGYGIKWPLALFYTSVIPVILTAALLANFQLLAKFTNWSWLGTFNANGIPESGLIKWVSGAGIDIPRLLITNSLLTEHVLRALGYMSFMIIGCIIFAMFWVKTTGMDASNQANKILSSGLQIPGFRRDPRVLESILKRYITPLTIMGAATIGILASLADISGALVSGTGILLAVMIIYHLYEEIAQQHALDMHPMLRKVMGK